MTESCCSAPALADAKPPAEPVSYRPLVVVALVALSAALALAAGGFPFMPALMGLFLCFLSALQLFSSGGFAMTFARYDPLAAKIPLYARAFPLLELSLGLAYLQGSYAALASILVVVVLAINTIGVIRVIRSGADVQCGCIGTTFRLPVGRVTLAENVAMIVMAILMLI